MLTTEITANFSTSSVEIQRPDYLHFLIVNNISSGIEIVKEKLEGVDLNSKVKANEFLSKLSLDQQQKIGQNNLSKISALKDQKISPLALAIILEDRQLVENLIVYGADLKDPILGKLAVEMINSEVVNDQTLQNRQEIFSALVYSGVDLGIGETESRVTNCDPQILSDAEFIKNLKGDQKILIKIVFKKMFLDSLEKSLIELTTEIYNDKRHHSKDGSHHSQTQARTASKDRSQHFISRLSNEGRASNRSSLDLAGILNSSHIKLNINGKEINLNQYLFVELVEKICFEGDRTIEPYCCGLFSRNIQREQSLIDLLTTNNQIEKISKIKKSVEQNKRISGLAYDKKLKLGSVAPIGNKVRTDIEFDDHHVIYTNPQSGIQAPSHDSEGQLSSSKQDPKPQNRGSARFLDEIEDFSFDNSPSPRLIDHHLLYSLILNQSKIKVWQ